MKHKWEGAEEKLYTEEREGLLKGAQSGDRDPRKALRREKNLVFNEDTCLETERVRSKMIPSIVGVELKRRRELNKRRLGWRVAWWGATEKNGGLTLAGYERKTSILRPALQSNQSSMCGLRSSRDRGGGGPNGQIGSIKRAADGRRQGSREIIDEEGEKYRAKNGFLRNTSTDSKRTTFTILISHASAPIRKERLSPTSKATREACRNEFVEKGGVPDRIENF